MKKGLKYLSLFGIFSLICMANVNAYSVSVEPKPGHATQFGYSTQTQTISGGVCNGVSVYCLDQGKRNQKSFVGCSFKDVSGTAFANVAGDHDVKEYLYRVIAHNSGIARTDRNKDKYLAPSLYGFPEAKNWRYENTSTSSETGNVNYKPTYNADGTANITATVNINNAGLNTSNFKTNKGVIAVTNNGNGQYTLNITQIPLAECEGADVVVTINAPGTSTTSKKGGLFYVDCHNGAQNYIIELTGNCSIDDLVKNGDGNLQFNFSVPDPNCKCGGSSTLCQECNENGTSQDNFENAKVCANSKAGFQAYCGTSLKKETNNDTNTTKLASHSGGNVTPSSKLAGNQYCDVYCLEKIDYKMPGRISTKNGRYFKLKKDWDLENPSSQNGENVKITGTRTCITSSIKEEKYETNMRNAQSAVLAAYNNYQREKAKQEYAKKPYTCTQEKKSETTCERYTSGKKVGQCKPWTIKTNTECTKVTCTKEPVKYTIYNGNFNGPGASVSSLTPQVVEYSEGNVTGSCKGVNADGTITPLKDVVDGNGNVTQVALTSEPGNPNAGAISGALQQMYDVINEYKSCFEWTNNYCFEPIAEFAYNEVYKNDMNGELPIIGTEKGTEVASYYTDVNRDYTGAARGYTQQSLNYIFADTKIVDSSNISQVDITSRYVKKEVTSSRTFDEGTKEIYTYHPYGTIVLENCAGGKCISLGKALPVALEHSNTSGIFPYDITFKNVGVGGNDTTCSQPNRINGEDCSLTAVEAGCDNDYSCYYTTQACPECEVKCECPPNDPDCFVEDNVCKYVVCPECIVTCVGCLWNNGDATFAWKQVALSDVFPNKENTKVGYNWNTDANVNPKSEKAEETLKEIEEASNKVYEKPQYSYVLTPTVMAEIRKYNDDANKENKNNIPTGGYSNNTLTCENGKRCTSSFLDLDFMKKAAKARNDKWEEYEDGSAWK